jgi:hypothetical protein
MNLAKNISLALALLFGAAVTGCAADAPTSDDPSDPNDPNDPVDPPLPENVDASGRYQLKSSIDLAQNAPGKAGDVARIIIDATNDPDDPVNWIIDRVIDQTSGTFKSFLQGSKPFVAGYLNDRLLEIAPDFVNTMLVVGNDFGEATKTFGLTETLDVSASGDGWLATRTVMGARFKIDNVESEYAFADFGATNAVAEGVGVTVEPSGKITLADHKINLAYGQVLRIALDGAIIPAVDPSAQNLAQLFQNQVNCQVVGEAIDQACRDAFGFSPGVSTFRTACTVGLQKAADFVYGKIAEIDGSALELGVTGTAKALDKDGNNQLDTIQTGTWAGTMSYAGTPATLTGATFFGARQ